jgi:hypothetical protein
MVVRFSTRNYKTRYTTPANYRNHTNYPPSRNHPSFGPRHPSDTRHGDTCPVSTNATPRRSASRAAHCRLRLPPPHPPRHSHSPSRSALAWPPPRRARSSHPCLPPPSRTGSSAHMAAWQSMPSPDLHHGILAAPHCRHRLALFVGLFKCSGLARDVAGWWGWGEVELALGVGRRGGAVPAAPPRSGGATFASRNLLP